MEIILYFNYVQDLAEMELVFFKKAHIVCISWLSDQNSVGNTLVFYLLLNSACTTISLFLAFFPPH